MRLTWLEEQYRRYDLGSVLADVASRSTWMLLLPVLVLGLLFRLWDIAQPFIGNYMWNEVNYATIARNFKQFGLLAPYNYGTVGGQLLRPRFGPPPLVSWLVYFSSQVLGTAEWVARLPILVLGMLSLVVLCFIARELYGAKVGLGAAFAAAIMPGIVFFSRHVALDGPMTAFGLAAFWTLLLAERRRQLWWLLPSSMFLALAIFTKYAAVLFIPSLAWVWLKMVRHSELPGKRARWVLPVAYLVVAALPAAAWLTFGLLTSSIHGARSPLSGYLERAYEWNPRAWSAALLVTWTRLSNQVGHGLWYPLLIAATLAITTGKIATIVKRHMGVILLVVPWFAQIVYPDSWYANEGYTYPALYGVAVVLALFLREALRQARRLPGFSGRNLEVSVFLLGALICASCLLDYRQVFHSWYSPAQSALLQHPVNAVTQNDPFVSARLVRSINVSHQPILADLPTTLYYAQDEYWRGRAVW
ncbi:MAG TPA: glycosyltransferase family 39 protein [Sedimentisphaerales bacterium]|nr:glycosyltransferase family 39 protein [Sedimentisphaerales bacterium]